MCYPNGNETGRFLVRYKWVKARDGAIFGVCKGLARTLEIPVGLFRVFWVLSILFLGAGIGLYILLAVSLPSEDKLDRALEPMFLGVCSKIAVRTELEIGIVRFLALALLLLSLGATFVGYIILYFVLDEKAASPSSRT
jgi:phage shock protein PspC (stress-responsive transcriptional regulator)